MANAWYGLAKQNQLDGTAIDFNTDDIAAVAVASTYTPSLSTHDFLDDITGGGHDLATSDPLGNPTITLGVFDTDDFTWPAVAGGDTLTYIALVQDTGTPATSRLIALYDTGTNLPLATNGSDINVQVNSGSTKWFALGWLAPFLAVGLAAARFAGFARKRPQLRLVGFYDGFLRAQGMKA